MAHFVTSAFFVLVAFASFAMVAFTLLEGRREIALALGMKKHSVRRMPRHIVRVRAPGRWQVAQSASSAERVRAAA